MKKKITLLFSLVTIIFSLSIFVCAETKYVAQIGDTKYTSAYSAWEAATYTPESDNNIIMLSDWVLDRKLDLHYGLSIVLHMNGHVIDRNIAFGSASDSGEAILIWENAELIINGGTTETQHNGFINDGVWIYDNSGEHILNGGVITGCANGDGGGAIHIQKNGKVTLNNVTIAANTSYDSSGAGAVRLQGDGSTLILNNSRLCYNAAYRGGGGAIRMEGSDSVVTIANNSSIDNNFTTKDNSDGAVFR